MPPTPQALHSSVQEQLGRKRQEQTSAPPGKEWVRGWDDLWKTKSNETVPPANPDAAAMNR